MYRNALEQGSVAYKKIPLLFFLIALSFAGSSSVACLEERKDPQNVLSKASDAMESKLGQEITVVGTAHNEKLGAGLSSGEERYFLKGKNEWEPEFLDKKVRVTGILGKRNLPVATHKDGLHSAGVSGSKDWAYHLENAKWELVP